MGYIYQAFSILKELIVIIIIFRDDIYKLEDNYLYNIDTYFFDLFVWETFKKLNIIGEKSRELEKLETQYLNETYQSIKFIKLGARENFFKIIEQCCE